MNLNSLNKDEKGSASILVIMVLLMLVTFAVLAVVTASSNLKISEKNAKWNQSYYELENLGTIKLKEILTSADNLLYEAPETWQLEIQELYPEVDFIEDNQLVFTVVHTSNRRLMIKLNYLLAQRNDLRELTYKIVEWREIPLEFVYEDDLQFGDPEGIDD